MLYLGFWELGRQVYIVFFYAILFSEIIEIFFLSKEKKNSEIAILFPIASLNWWNIPQLRPIDLKHVYSFLFTLKKSTDTGGKICPGAQFSL